MRITIFMIAAMIGVLVLAIPAAANGYGWDDWDDWDNGWYRSAGGYPVIATGYPYPAAYPVAVQGYSYPAAYPVEYPGHMPFYFDDD